ncbi:DUF5671 domain-containing protein [Shimia sediminis]|uniref:DUF5671 domain-containing protein n=1 Tax=Shimia sediminis TaxID=2497945 RepID=UPI000F8F2985|nr:DUF5671 domain-containing protein [Shimia sediminis]
MNNNETLNQFVRDALSAGHTRDEITNALGAAGWSPQETSSALKAFSTIEFSPPVPKPRPQLTARDAFFYIVYFTTLTFVSVYFVTLMHSILDLSIPMSDDHNWRERQATNSARWSIAVLLVATPVFLWMSRSTRQRIAQDPGQRRSLMRKWLTYLALFVAALFLFGDAVYVIYSFLEGEATFRFLLKALVVACVSSGVIAVYLRDAEADSDEH